MNSSSEPLAYSPMEYREAGELTTGEHSEPHGRQEAPTPVEPQGDPAESFAARLEEERRTITSQLRQEAERELQRTRLEVTRAVDGFTQQREEYFHNVESEVVGLVLAIARRILHRETQLDPRLLASLVRYELEQLDAATSVHLVVSPDTLTYWNEAAATMPHAIEVSPDAALLSGDVRIEAALGVTSVNFERELKEIECGFFDLLSHRPKTAESLPVRVQ